MKKSTYSELLEKAKKNIERDSERGIDRQDLIAALVNLISVDVAASKLQLAKAIIKNEKKSGSTIPTGQMCLPGMEEAYNYEPNRLIQNDKQHLIEQDFAPVTYKFAEAGRAAKHAKEANASSDRKWRESELFGKWVAEQQKAGRSEKLTFGDFVRETELFHPFKADAAGQQ